MKGSIAVPLVLTVGPAAARAQSSSAACLNRDAARAAAEKPTTMVSVDADDWLRKSVDLLQLSVWKDGGQQQLPGKYFLGVDKRTYWRLDEVTWGAPTASPTAYTTGNCTAARLNERRFALVYVGDDGRETGYAFEKNGGDPVTGSCWTSIAVFRA